jgi:RNA polymerase sigma-70 factor (ECF subfamily)
MSLQAAEITDQQLINGLREGKREFLGTLFNRYYDALVRFALPMLKDTDSSRDAVQEVFFRLWNKREELTVNSSVKAYLYMSVKNHCLNLMKKDQRITWINESEELENVGGNSDSTMSHIQEKDLQKRLRDALDSIPPKCRQVFELSRYGGKSYKEIAEMLDLSVKTVENQMSKALQILRVQLLPYLKVLIVMAGLV